MSAFQQSALVDALIILVTFQYLMIAGFLFAHRPVRPAGNFFLAIFFALIGLNLIDGFLMIHGFYMNHSRFALLEDSFFLSYGPLLLVYSRTVINRSVNPFRRMIVHFIPFLLLFFGLVLYWQLMNTQQREKIISMVMSQQLPTVSSVIVSSLLFVHFFVYLFLCFVEIKKHRDELRNTHSSFERAGLQWLVFTLNVIGITFISSWLTTFFSLHGWAIPSQVMLSCTLLVLLYYIVTLVFRAFRDPTLFSGAEPREKQESSSIPDEQESAMILTRLHHLMDVEHLYRDADLTIDLLAAKVGTTSRKLSSVINGKLNRKFFDYINEQRIQEAMSLLGNDPDKGLTVQEVMYRVGFQSKSSFNTLFRQRTGMTPSAYRTKNQ